MLKILTVLVYPVSTFSIGTVWYLGWKRATPVQCVGRWGCTRVVRMEAWPCIVLTIEE